jgi:hypothetical protein
VPAVDFADSRYHGAGDTTAQQLDLFDGKQLLYMPKKAEGAWIEIPFTVEKKEPLRLLLNATKAEDFGKYRISLNGVTLSKGTDFYSPAIAWDKATQVVFDAAGQFIAVHG